MQPKISVIMNCHNSDAYLKEAIDSIYAQTYVDWEIVFYDNASTDQSAAIAKSYDDRMQYYCSEQLLSLGAARNEAIKKARGDYVCFLDCDDLWLPTKLAEQINCFAKQNLSARPLGLCYTASDRMNSEGNILLSYARERKPASGNVYQKLIHDCFMSCSSVMIDKKILNELGGFDIHWEQVEDWDLWLRIAKNHDAAYVNQPLTQIRLHASNQSKKIFFHFDEKLALLNQLQLNDRSAKKECRRAIARLVLQKNIAAFLLASQCSGVSRLRSLFSIGYCIIKNPMGFFETFKKYFNRDMVALFRLKFMKNT